MELPAPPPLPPAEKIPEFSVPEKPQIDLKEFLQQMGVFRDEDLVKEGNAEAAVSECSVAAPMEFNGAVDFGQGELIWDELVDMRSLEDQCGVQVRDVHEDVGFPFSLWDL